MYRYDEFDETIVAHMKSNICRCGSYRRIIASIERAVKASGVDFRGHDLRRTAASLYAKARPLDWRE